MKHMSVTRLINEHLKRYPESHFFDRDTLKFFGERLSEMWVLNRTEEVNGHECYVLSSYQHNAPVPGRKYHYFDTTTFENVVK